MSVSDLNYLLLSNISSLRSNFYSQCNHIFSLRVALSETSLSSPSSPPENNGLLIEQIYLCMKSINFAYLNIRLNSMGNDSPRSEGETFQKHDWELVSTQETCSVWKNRNDPSQSIVEHSIYTSNDSEEDEEKQMFILRKDHPTIVASRYLISESSRQFCSSSHHQKLFIEKIPIRLSDVEHIPFPDFLHLYYQCLHGFQQLSKHMGCFPIEEEYIGINEKGVVKVWMNQNYFKNYYTGGKVSEQFMVKNIIEIIEKNLDHNQIPTEIPSVRNYLYRNTDKLHFQQANREFHEYLIQYINGRVPTRLQCIDHVGGIDIIANRQKQPQQARNHNPVNQTYHPQQTAPSKQGNRPQLIDSQILKEQFPLSSPRIETTPRMESERARVTNNIQIIPNLQNQILSPSTVKENTPIVRKQASTFYQSPSPFNYNHLQNGRSIKTSGIQAHPQIQYKLSERPESKSFGSKPVSIVNSQRIIVQPIPNPYFNLPENNSMVAGKTSLIQLVQPETPKYNQSTIKTFDFQDNSKFVKEHISMPSFQTPLANLPPIKKPLANSFYPRPLSNEHASSKSLSDRTENKPISFLPTSGSFTQQIEAICHKPTVTEKSIVQNDPPNHYQSQATRSEKIIFDLLENANTKNNYNSNQYQDNVSRSTTINNFLKYPNKEETNVGTANNVKISQYTTVDIDDGKSSSDFFKRLNQVSHFEANLPPSDTQSLPTYKNTPDKYIITPENGPYARYVNSTFNKEVDSLENFNHSEEVLSNEQFGKNAVSNIISNQSGIQIASQKNTNYTPLKFEKNLDMKYSMFKPDEPPSPTYQNSYVYKKYEPHFDADILADIQRLQS